MELRLNTSDAIFNVCEAFLAFSDGIRFPDIRFVVQHLKTLECLSFRLKRELRDNVLEHVASNLRMIPNLRNSLFEISMQTAISRKNRLQFYRRIRFDSQEF